MGVLRPPSVSRNLISKKHTIDTLATAEIAIMSEDITAPHDMDRVCSSKDLGTGTPYLSSDQETFLRERYSTKLEDPRTGRWIRSWRTEG